MEEVLYDLAGMREFVGIDLGREPLPDEATVRIKGLSIRGNKFR